MTRIFRNEKEFQITWDRFLSENSNASWLYLPKFLEYQLIYSKLPKKNDISFVLKAQDGPVAICPLFLNNHDNNLSFSWLDYDGYILSPLIKSSLHPSYKKKVEKLCYETIDELAYKYKVKKTMIMLDPLSNKYNHNILTQYSYLDSSIGVSIVNLENNISHIWSNLRKSYKSIINNGLNKFKVMLFDSNNFDLNIFNNYKELHHLSAGKITRSQKTWDIQCELLKSDNALLIGLQDNSQYVAFSYFFHLNNYASYGSSSDDPNYKSEIPLEHTIIWSAIEYYKNRNFHGLDMGWQPFSQQIFDQPSEKDLNISFFKRGFGGDIITSYRGIKYHRVDFMREEITKMVSLLFNYTK